jgi:hypothetical protein
MTGTTARGLVAVFALSLVLAAAASAQDRAQEVLGQARSALGNPATLTGVTSLSVGATVRRVVQTVGMELSSDVQLEFLFPDKYRRTESMSVGPVSRTIIMAVNGDQLMYDDGGMAAMVGMDPSAPGPQREQMIKNLKQDAFRLLTIWLITPPATASCTFTYAGIAEAPDGKADIVDVKGANGLNLRLFLDTGTHRLLMATFQSESVDPEAMKALTQKLMEQAKADPQNAQKLVQGMREEFDKLPKKTITSEMHFSDYRAMGGVMLPSKMTVDVAGQGHEEWAISSFKLNPTLKPDRFEKK